MHLEMYDFQLCIYTEAKQLNNCIFWEPDLTGHFIGQISPQNEMNYNEKEEQQMHTANNYDREALQE